jgi:hypothetical protein
VSKEEFMYWLRGALRSLSMWFAAVVAATPLWWPDVQPMLAQWLGSDERATRALTAVMAVVIVWLRIRTTEPLTIKGGKQLVDHQLKESPEDDAPPNA